MWLELSAQYEGAVQGAFFAMHLAEGVKRSPSFEEEYAHKQDLDLRIQSLVILKAHAFLPCQFKR